jgi:hypothetical protein
MEIDDLSAEGVPHFCPKCGAGSGGDWSQCEGRCPMGMSPHYTAGEDLKWAEFIRREKENRDD